MPRKKATGKRSVKKQNEEKQPALTSEDDSLHEEFLRAMDQAEADTAAEDEAEAAGELAG